MDVASSINEKQLICMLSKVLAKLDRKFSHSHLDSFFLNEHVNHQLHPLPWQKRTFLCSSKTVMRTLCVLPSNCCSTGTTFQAPTISTWVIKTVTTESFSPSTTATYQTRSPKQWHSWLLVGFVTLMKLPQPLRASELQIIFYPGIFPQNQPPCGLFTITRPSIPTGNLIPTVNAIRTAPADFPSTSFNIGTFTTSYTFLILSRNTPIVPQTSLQTVMTIAKRTISLSGSTSLTLPRLFMVTTVSRVSLGWTSHLIWPCSLQISLSGSTG